MARRSKPRWGWELNFDVAEMRRRKEGIDFADVERMFGAVDPDPVVPLTSDVSYLLDLFYFETFGVREATWSERQAALDEIRDHLVALRDRVDGLDRATQHRLMEALLRTYRERRLRFGREPTLRALARAAPREDEALATLDFLIASFDNVALPRDPVRRGRRPNTALKNFIFSLAATYREQTHQDPLEGFYRNAITERYEGPLVEIAEHLLDHFAPELNISNASIGEHIRRTIGDRAK